MLILCVDSLNPKVASPPFAATFAAAAPLRHYQVDRVHQPLGLMGQADSETFIRDTR